MTTIYFGININFLFLWVAKHCFPCCVQEASVALFPIFCRTGIFFVFQINDWSWSKLKARTGSVTLCCFAPHVTLKLRKVLLREADVRGGAIRALVRRAIFLVLLMVLAFQWSSGIDFPSLFPSCRDCFRWLAASQMLSHSISRIPSSSTGKGTHSGCWGFHSLYCCCRCFFLVVLHISKCL